MRPAQARARLLDYARAHKVEAQTVLNDFARERFLMRLSAHAALRGRLLFVFGVRQGQLARLGDGLAGHARALRVVDRAVDRLIREMDEWRRRQEVGRR